MLLLLCATFIVPVLTITGMVVHHARRDIIIAGQERVGGDYVLAMLPVMRREAQGALPDPALIAAFRAKTDVLDQGFSTRSLRNAWLQVTGDAPAFTQAAADLIAEIGNRSGLVLDGRLDTFYLVAIGIMKAPPLAEDLASLDDLIDRFRIGRSDAKDQRQLTLIRGVIESQRLAMEASFSQASAAGLARKDDRISLSLAKPAANMGRALSIVLKDVERLEAVCGGIVGCAAMADKASRDVARTRMLVLDVQAVSLATFGTLIREQESEAKDRLYVLMVIVSGTTLLAAALGWYATRLIERAVAKVTSRMRDMAAGDVDSAIPYVGLSNELGEIAAGIEFFQQSLIERAALSSELQKAGERLEGTVKQISLRNAALEAEAELQRRRAAADERRARNALVCDLEQTIGQILNGLLSRANALGYEADAMSSNAAAARAEAVAAERSTRSAFDGVTIVATAIDQLARANRQIRLLMEDVSVSVDHTMCSVSGAQSRIEGLDAASSRIGEVIELIARIASQTRLLALNASIEAARAGDAGAGFAVVASEVKALAGRAASATREVEDHIKQIRTEAELTIASIHDIGTHIDKVAGHAVAVAKAVQQQSIAATEIAASAASAASATSATSDAVAVMATAASQAYESAETMRMVANDVTTEADRLKGDVDHFVARVA
ncbi:methyl-accepting chemotaxis protein [Sphingomonas sp. YR710]|uniref:methyl-accepting chemotaxis protein n=1 Tax=Sphingomonas sp. YR710 TaxID=1882773 RepID=UPI0015A07E77|nr:methyl-accepting chemotaxis protein [Sphingomonas sp. YR710]